MIYVSSPIERQPTDSSGACPLPTVQTAGLSIRTDQAIERDRTSSTAKTWISDVPASDVVLLIQGSELVTQSMRENVLRWLRCTPSTDGEFVGGITGSLRVGYARVHVDVPAQTANP